MRVEQSQFEQFTPTLFYSLFLEEYLNSAIGQNNRYEDFEVWVFGGKIPPNIPCKVFSYYFAIGIKNVIDRINQMTKLSVITLSGFHYKNNSFYTIFMHFLET